MKKILLVFAIINSSILVAVSQDAETYFRGAIQKAQQGKMLDAQVLIEKAIKLDPTNIDYHLWKSDLHYQQQDMEDAFASVYIAMSIDAKNDDIYNAAGKLYASTGYYDSAVAMYQRAVHLSTNDSAKYSYLGNIGCTKLMYRDFQGAVDDLEKVLAVFPNSISALTNASTAYEELGKVDVSIQYLTKVIAIDSMFVGGYINLALLYTKTDQYDKAQHNFKKALLLDSEDPLIYSNRGNMYYRMKQYDRAIKDINKSLDLYPANAYAYRNRALVYFALNKNEEGCRDVAAAQYYGFQTYYGNEVNELAAQYCQHNSNLTDLAK